MTLYSSISGHWHKPNTVRQKSVEVRVPMVISRRSWARIGPSRAMAPALQIISAVYYFVKSSRLRLTKHRHLRHPTYFISTITSSDPQIMTHSINTHISDNLDEICISCVRQNFQYDQKRLYYLQIGILPAYGGGELDFTSCASCSIFNIR